MPGPAPAEQRRRRNEPARGEWVDLPAALETPVLPSLPSGKWRKRTKDAWASWQSDPATSQFGPADIQLALDLAYVYESWVREPSASREGEIRQRLDSLGLSPKGRQDRRWRYSSEKAEPPADQGHARPQHRRRDRRGHLIRVK